jgi:protein SCO1/2
MMAQAKNVSVGHVVVAIVLLAGLSSFPLFFIDPNKEDPLAVLERLDGQLRQLPETVQTDLFNKLKIRNGQMTLLPLEQMKKLSESLEKLETGRETWTAEKWSERVEKIVESLDRRSPVPLELQGVGITEKPGAALPLDLTFRDESGRDVTLGSFFRAGLPVILTLNYSDCPQLCHLQLHNLVELLRKETIIPGRGFIIVTVSINPRESNVQARNARRNYLGALEAPDAQWHFLTTDNESSIKALADTVGFGYRYDPIRKDFAHSSALIFCTPKGVVSQYYQGIAYQGDEIRTRIADAAAGKEYFSGVEDNPYNCKVYDGSKPYVALAGRIMRIVSVTLAVLLALTLTILWMIPSKKPEVLPRL